MFIAQKSNKAEENHYSKGNYSADNVEMDSVSHVPSIRMNNNRTIPVLGLGTWQATGDEVKKAVEAALRCGYRHIDTAMVYENETEIGEAVNEFLQTTKTPRDELFITTKLAAAFMAADDVKPACLRSLQKLNLGVIDLYLIHVPTGMKNIGWDIGIPTDSDGNPMFVNHDIVACWKAMEKLVDEGLVRSIGVSNFNSEQITRILSNCRIKPVTNQIECHAYFPQKNFTEFLKAKDIFVTAYAPLGSPNAVAFANAIEGTPILNNRVIENLSKKYNKSPAQILLRNLFQRGMVVIPKSTNPGRIQGNLQIFDFEISSADMEAIACLETGHRRFAAEKFFPKSNPEFPFSLPF